MRILALIPQLGPGGAERMMARLVSYLADRHEIMLMTWEAPGVLPFYPVPPGVKLLRADLFGTRGRSRLGGIAGRVAAVRRQIRSFRPSVVLSFMDAMNIVALVASFGLHIPVVVSERDDPRHHDIGCFKTIMRRLLYPRSRCLVVQTKRIADYFSSQLGNKISVVANPVVIPDAMARPKQPGADGRFRIVAAGRLTYQKAFDGLIEAFAALTTRFPHWDLIIFGEGEDRESLEQGIRDRQLEGRVRLPGVQGNLADELAAAHIMAFPSRYEGFPNVLAEGLAAGLPAVGYAEVSGVEDLILDGVTGLLVSPPQDRSAFAQALAQLMADANLREKMGAAARRHVVQWAPDRILPLWEEVLTNAAS
jgi:glycosyltransferase involved in cell wall biosynthesis